MIIQNPIQTYQEDINNITYNTLRVGRVGLLLSKFRYGMVLQ